MRKCGLCCRPLSVCLSVTLVYCIQTAEVIVKLLSRPDTKFPGNPFSVGAKYTGKFCDFRLKSPFILETARDRPMITMEHKILDSMVVDYDCYYSGT